MHRIPCVLVLVVVGLAGNAYAQVTLLDNGGGTKLVGQRSSVTIGGDGLPLIAYQSAAGSSIRLAHCLKADCTTSELSSPFPSGTSEDSAYGAGLATGANGLGVLAWQQSDVGLRFAVCLDARCSTVTTKTLDPITYYGAGAGHSAVVVRNDGRPFIAYSYPPTADLRIADCGDATCGTVTVRTVDATGNTGATPSVALLAAGYPVISYYDQGNGDLRRADCTNVDCSSWNLTTVESTGNVGDMSSIAAKPSGELAIAYQGPSSVRLAASGYTQDIPSGSLSVTGMSVRFGKNGFPTLVLSYGTQIRVVRCLVPSCMTFETHDLETGNTLGGDFSLAIGSDGLPLIPFFDQPPAGLYVAHCRDEACEYVNSPPPADYYTVTPCRLYDSRLASPSPLLTGETRSIAVAGNCDIPMGAVALALNITVTQPTAQGNLRLFPTGQPLPLVSTLNYSAGQTRANNAVAGLSDSGSLSVYCSQISGSVHFIVDVDGYFQ